MNMLDAWTCLTVDSPEIAVSEHMGRHASASIEGMTSIEGINGLQQLRQGRPWATKAGGRIGRIEWKTNAMESNSSDVLTFDRRGRGVVGPGSASDIF